MSTYTLNIATGSTPPAVFVKQYDKGYEIDFKIYNGPDIYDLTGHTILVNLHKPDNNVYIGIGEITDAGDGAVSVRLDSERQMTAAEGEGLLELVMVRSGKAQATANARWIVQKSPGSDVVISASVVNGLIALAANIAGDVSDAETAASAAAGALAEALSAQAAAESARDEAASIAMGNLRDVLFPVGSVVQYTDASIDPNTLIGGKWERIQGKFLFGADSSHAIGSEGGSEAVELTTANLPAHRHFILSTYGATESFAITSTLARYDRSYGQTENEHYTLMATSREANGGRTSATGSGTAHNNMPPYLAVYMWERTA